MCYIIIMNFSGAYEEQSFYRDYEAEWLDLRDVQGTNCYCDGEAEAVIRSRIKEYGPRGVHFLDSGNYHYVSKIWLDLVDEDFDLLVYDHHTDMQMPMFGDILSCGGWIKWALDTHPRLKRVYLAGPPESGRREIEAEGYGDRVVWIGEDELAGGAVKDHLAGGGLPLYISLDKDILDTSYGATNWDQGEASLTCVLESIKEAAACRSIIGVDICGEDPDGAGRRGGMCADSEWDHAGADAADAGRDHACASAADSEWDHAGADAADAERDHAPTDAAGINDRANREIISKLVGLCDRMTPQKGI